MHHKTIQNSMIVINNIIRVWRNLEVYVESTMFIEPSTYTSSKGEIDMTIHIVTKKNTLVMLIIIGMIISFFPATNKVHAMGGPNLALNSDGIGFPKIIASNTCNCGDNALSTLDGVFDYNNGNHNRWTNWPLNANETLDIEFESPTAFNQVRLYLFNDGNGVKLPSSYQIQYLNSNNEYVNTTNPVYYPTVPTAALYDVATTGNTINVVNFDTVISEQLRIVMNAGDASTGLVEIEVFLKDHGSGSVDNPYVISTPVEFELMRNNLHASFVLANPIDLSGVTWTPIGQEEAFQGKFDGQGYAIHGLSINSDSNYTGLFGAIGSTGVIENLTIDGAELLGGSNVGVLAGGNQGSINHVHIKNASVSGSVNVGGLVGQNSSLINNSSSAANITGNEFYIGGLVGYNHSGSAIANSHASGNITGPSNTGGLVGQNAASTITNSYALGQVSSGGALVGYNYQGAIIGSFASGLVAGSAQNLVGDNEGVMTNSHWRAYIVSFNSDGGSAVNIQGVEPSTMAIAPAAPTRNGYEFLGWYSDAELSTPYDFDVGITAHTTIYAKWLVEIDDIVRIINTGTALHKDINHDGIFDHSDAQKLLKRISPFWVNNNSNE
jgi:uncharacterized repeat protein (TIGR02543 family)